MGTKLLDPERLQAYKFRFGTFEVDLQQRELYNRGIRIGLQQKPFRILELLLRKRGSLVTRDELAQYLWPNLHVSFDRGLNTAINVLRRALGDSPSNCRYIETRSGLGYRFIAHVEDIGQPPPAERRHGASDSIVLQRIETAAERVSRQSHTASPEAYQDYLKGLYFFSKMSEEDLRKSIAHFESALKQDPHSALAYTGLANTYSVFALLGVLPAAAARNRVREFITSALQIDPELAEAHASLASSKKLFDWDWAGAEQDYLAALGLNPNYANGRRGYAALLCSMGRMEEAVNETRRAQELDPLSMLISAEAAWTLYMCRDFQGAMEQSWKTLALEPRYAPAQHTLGLACEQLGMHEEAITELENARTCSGRHPATIAALSHAHASSGNREEALRNLCELEEASRRRQVSPYWMSIVHAGLAANDLAFKWLEKAFEERDVWLVWMKVDPRFDPIRSDARFSRALQRLGLRPDQPS
jgi:DNA-binding winged helix-turn-helix (wHTH) protein